MIRDPENPAPAPMAQDPRKAFLDDLRQLRRVVSRMLLHSGANTADKGCLHFIMLQINDREDAARADLGFAPRPVAPVHTGNVRGAA